MARDEQGLPDLGDSEQIGRLVRTFYARVRQDDLLGPVFEDQAGVDWDEHVHKLTAFWCRLELGIPGFEGAPTRKHARLSARAPFRAEQFERWVSLFHDTIDRGWSGPHANSIKHRAVRIAIAQSRRVPTAEPWSPPGTRFVTTSRR